MDSVFQAPFLSYVIAMTIPLVIFLIWADSFERRLAEKQKEEPLYERTPELEKIRFVSFLILSTELILFLGASSVRDLLTPLPQFIWMGMVLTQIFFQTRTEKKVRPPEKPEFDFFQALSQGFFCWILGFSIHLLSIFLGIQIPFWIAHTFSLSRWPTTVFLLVGAGFGILGGVYLNLSLMGFYLRRILPHSRLATPSLEKKIRALLATHSPFRRFSSFPICVIHLEAFSFYQLVITGGRKPTLFLSLSAIQNLSETQLEAVIRYQLSHLQLRPFRQRFLLGGTLLFLVLGIGLGSLLLSESQGNPSLSVLSSLFTLGLFFLSFRWMQNQRQQQERKADVHCIQKGGVSKKLWIQTLLQLDSLQLKGSPEPLFVSPEIATRIQQLDPIEELPESASNQTQLECSEEQKAA